MACMNRAAELCYMKPSVKHDPATPPSLMSYEKIISSPTPQLALVARWSLEVIPNSTTD